MKKTQLQKEVDYLESIMRYHDTDTWYRYNGREHKVHCVHYTGNDTYAIELNNVCILGCTTKTTFTHCNPYPTALRTYYAEEDLVKLDPDHMPT